MNRKVRLVTYLAVFMVLLLQGTTALHAQAPSKGALPQVPITYEGDTNETIMRRAQWIEGAKKERALNWWGILTGSEGGRVIAEFNKVYPFITVSYWRGRGEEVAAKLEADQSGTNPTADIVLGGEPYNYPRWRNKGMMVKYIDIIPGIKNMDRRMYSKHSDYALPGNNGITPAYNTKLVSPAEAPKSWEDILHPKWKGHVALTRDMKAWLTLALDEGGWGIEKTESFLRGLRAQQLIWGAGHTAGHSLLMAGEFKIYGESYVYHTLQAQNKGAPVEWSRVNPVVITGPSMTLQSRAPHPNAARLLLEWLFSPQGLVIYDRITYYGVATPGSGTRLSRALEGLNLIYRTEESIIQAIEMGLAKRFEKIIGASPD